MKKFLAYFVLFSLLFFGSITLIKAVSSSGDMATGTSSHLTINPRARTFWRRPYPQGIRVSMVHASDGSKHSGTRSVDYTNLTRLGHYVSPPIKYSKTEYLLNTGYQSQVNKDNMIRFQRKSPPVTLPRFVNLNSPDTGLMLNYFMNYYSPSKAPHNLIAMLKDLQIGNNLNNLILGLEELSICRTQASCKSAKQKIENYNDYVFLVEPLSFVTVFESSRGYTNYALTSTESGVLLSSEPGWVKGYSHGAVPNSLYITQEDLFKNGANLQVPEPPFPSKRWLSSEMTSNLGIGVGVFNIFAETEKIPIPPPPNEVEPCTPDYKMSIRDCLDDESQQQGYSGEEGKGVFIEYRDDNNWDCLWRSDDHSEAVENTMGYCRIACREEATVDFPGPIDDLRHATHFEFNPINTTIKRECAIGIDTDRWNNNYRAAVNEAQNAYTQLRRARARFAAFEAAKAAVNNNSTSATRSKDGVTSTSSVTRTGPCETQPVTDDGIIIEYQTSGGSAINTKSYEPEGGTQVYFTHNGFSCNLINSRDEHLDKNYWARQEFDSDYDRSDGFYTVCTEKEDGGDPGYELSRYSPINHNLINIQPLGSGNFECVRAHRFNHKYVSSSTDITKCNLTSTRLAPLGISSAFLGRRSLEPGQVQFQMITDRIRALNQTLGIEWSSSYDLVRNAPFTCTMDAGHYGSYTLDFSMNELEQTINGFTYNIARLSDGTCYLHSRGTIEVGDKYDVTYSSTGIASPGTDLGTWCGSELVGNPYAGEVNNWEGQLNTKLSNLLGLENALRTCNESFNMIHLEEEELPKVRAVQTQDFVVSGSKTTETLLDIDLDREEISKITSGTRFIQEDSINMPSQTFHCSSGNLTNCSTKSFSAAGKADFPSNYNNMIDEIISYNHEFNLPDNINRYIIKPENIAVNANELASLYPAHYSSGRYEEIEYPNYTILYDEDRYSKSGSLRLVYENISKLADVYSGSLKQGGRLNYTCPYSFRSDDEDCDPEVKICDPEKTLVSEFIFRTIHLDDPFVDVDGNLREAGFNWRAHPSYIKKITENRGEYGEDLYRNKEPMYVIDFTGANRFKLSEIRNYNKSTKYDDFKMNCVIGRECKSEFLRSSIMNNVIEGCAYNSSMNWYSNKDWENICGDSSS